MKDQFIKNLLLSLKEKRLWIQILLGFSAGLPIITVYGTVKIWMRREGIDLSTVGMMGWVALPYSLNFLMGPLLDRYTLNRLGKRRSWIFLTQAGLVLSFIMLSFASPFDSVLFCAIATLFVAIFSATQDVAIDAYRREILPEKEIGLGASVYVYGYRVATLIASGVGLWMVDPDTLGLSFNQLFLFLAVLMSLSFLTTWLADEPPIEESGERKFSDYVVSPFKEFFARRGAKIALLTLAFIFLFKFGDSFAATMYGAFYVDMGYSNKVIAEVAKGIGFVSTMLGLAVGATAVFKWGAVRCLVAFGVLQALSTVCFSLLTFASFKGGWWPLAFVVGFEDFAAGLGTVALISFMAKVTSTNYTATQYALFASLAALGRTLFGGFSGIVLEQIGYVAFFSLGGLLALPGLALIYFMRKIYL